MPVEILTAGQRIEWERFPAEIDETALAAFFCFADDELEQLAALRGLHGQFAVAVAVGAVRWLGLVPEALDELPEPAAALVCEQLDIGLSAIDPGRLAGQPRGRVEQVAVAVRIAGFRACMQTDLQSLQTAVADRALGHDGPLALLRHAADLLRRQQILRPGLSVLERLVSAARSDADGEIHRCVRPLLSVQRRDRLDALLVVADDAGVAAVKALGQETRGLSAIGEAIGHLELLRGLGVDHWDLGVIPANRRRMLAQYVRHATSQAIARRPEPFRYPALLAFCSEAAARLTDEIVDRSTTGSGSRTPRPDAR